MIVIPIDALNGANIKHNHGGCSWYKGPSLLELLDGLTLSKREPELAIRIPVLDKLKDQGQFIYGKVE